MDIIETDATPVSTDPPTPQEELKSREMEQYLMDQGLYESKEEEEHRNELLAQVEDICRRSVLKILEAKGRKIDHEKEELGRLFSFGSFRMGINEPSADLDTMFVGPGIVDRENFFCITSTMLKQHPEATDVVTIDEAYVPIISLKFGGIDFDVSYAPISRHETFLPKDFDVLDDSNLIGADDETVRSLNGRRVTDTIMKIVPKKKPFFLALKAFRYWARRRGLYKNVMGYLGGVNCAILCAYSALRYPNASAVVILQKCFEIFASWEWPKPVCLTNVQKKMEIGHDASVWDRESNPKDIFPNSCYTVTESTRLIMTNEFRKARDVIGRILEGKSSWSELFAEIPFFKKYRHFIQVEATAEDEESFNRWYGVVESRLRRLVTSLELGGDISAHLLPKSFAPPDRELCKQFYIAFNFKEKPTGQEVDLSNITNGFRFELNGKVDANLPVNITFKVLNNTSSGNELPDFLFPEGKKVKKSRKRNQPAEGNEDKKSKNN